MPETLSCVICIVSYTSITMNRIHLTGIYTMAPLPATLQEAIERGELTEAQLRELIRLEAEELGLTFEEAVKRARERRLPKTPLGADLELLVQLLPP